MMQIVSRIIFCLTLNEQSVLGDLNCGNCNKSTSAYEPVCAVGEKAWFRHIFLKVGGQLMAPRIINYDYHMTILVVGSQNIFLRTLHESICMRKR